MTTETNFAVLKKSRIPPKVGDVFGMKLPDGDYIFGLVVKANVPSGPAPMPGANLLYIFKDRSTSLDPELDKLRPDRLLLPPIWTNALGWSRGYFQTVRHIEVTKAHLLPNHCFFLALGNRYLDEQGNQVAKPTEPCGEWGLVSYRWIDDHVSDALSIPRAPLDKVPNQ
jgi:Immunity protein 26